MESRCTRTANRARASLSQHRHVQVYHFVSRGTIEHGMLGVLQFKTSMFEGVLDGGDKMKKFMETVEQVSAHITIVTPAPEETPEPEAFYAAKLEDDILEAQSPAETIAIEQGGWNELLTAGAQLLEKLGHALLQAPVAQKATTPRLGELIQCNAKTGAPELHIPLPNADTAKKLANALNAFAGLLMSNSRK